MTRHLTSLHLELPDDIHKRHWNGASLDTLHRALTQVTSINQTLQHLTITLFSRKTELGLPDDGVSQRGGGWSHDETFLVIVTALPSMDITGGISWLKLQNFHLQEPSHLVDFLTSGGAPRELELVNFLLGSPWKGVDKLDWKASRLRLMTITGSLSPVQEKTNWIAHFLERLSKTATLFPLTVIYHDKNVPRTITIEPRHQRQLCAVKSWFFKKGSSPSKSNPTRSNNKSIVHIFNQGCCGGEITSCRRSQNECVSQPSLDDDEYSYIFSSWESEEPAAGASKVA